MRIGRGPRSMRASTFRIAASTSRDFGTRTFSAYRDAPTDKPTERPERPGSRGSHEMEPRQRRLETDVQLGIALTRAQRLAQGGREERVPCDVHAIPRAQQEMIDEPLRAVAESESQARARGDRRGNGAPGRDRHRDEPRDQPACTG